MNPNTNDWELELRMAEASGNSDAVGRIRRRIAMRVAELYVYANSADNREEMERRMKAVEFPTEFWRNR